MPRDEGYLLDNRQREAGERLERIAELFDAWTFAHVARLGLAPGARAWEVGAGGPTVPAWLAERVGPRGRVLATDVEPAWLRGLPANVEVRVHDAQHDPAPAEEFDLVHARLVLLHLPGRDRALRAMAGALRPGGWLLVEDADPALQPLACPGAHGPEEELANWLRAAFRELLARRGANLAFGRRLPALLRGAGLQRVEADAFFPLAAPASAALERATVALVRADLVREGFATNDEVERHLASLAAGRLDVATAPLVSAWGQRPA